jgi:cytochrome c-type biogenesis protein CcmE
MSKNIDEELAAAAGLDEDGAPEAAGSDPGAEPSGEADPVAENGTMAVPEPADMRPEPAGETPSRNLGFLLALLVMAAGIVVLFTFGFKEAAIYSTPVEQIIAKGDEMIGRRVRIEGELVPGTLRKRDQPCEYRFIIRGQGKGKQLPIVYPQCVIPDTFRDIPDGGVLVTVEGAMTKEREF